MKYKSRAISLTYIRQGENSIISKILTEEKPKDLNISKERIEILANNIVKNYLTKKKG